MFSDAFCIFLGQEMVEGRPRTYYFVWLLFTTGTGVLLLSVYYILPLIIITINHNSYYYSVSLSWWTFLSPSTVSGTMPLVMKEPWPSQRL